MLTFNAATIMYTDLKFTKRIGCGVSGCVWKGEWVPKSKVVAIKTLIDVNNREVSFICSLFWRFVFQCQRDAALITLCTHVQAGLNNQSVC